MTTAVTELATPRVGWKARLRMSSRADRLALAILIVWPIAMFVIPALVGHPAIVGDNLLQNFPLRVLSGRLMREGHLPLFNQYTFSGSPLLGALNAGSFFPATGFFIILGPIAAWVANLLVVYWAAGLGMFMLLRFSRCSSFASLLAALSYSLTGAMSGQMIHLGVIQGQALLPWLVLALLAIERRVVDESGPGAGLSALLGVVVGLVMLTGEPRAIADAEIVGVVVTLWLALRNVAGEARHWRHRAQFLFYAALGAGWGALLGAAQLLTGRAAIASSERASISYQFFGSGSLPVKWTTLLDVPYLFGGDGWVHLPGFFANYNLPEITGYVGVLPLFAAGALLALGIGRRRAANASRWTMWLGLLAVGLVCTWGSFTPAGNLLHLIPLFGRTRLQSRNLAIVDLALCALVAFWIDRAQSDDATQLRLEAVRWRRGLTLLPGFVAIGFTLAVVIDPVPVIARMGNLTQSAANAADNLRPGYVITLVLNLAAMALIFFVRRLPARRRRLAIALFVVADLAIFLITCSTGLVPGQVGPLEPALAAGLPAASSGRFVIDDPPVKPLGTLVADGEANIDIFTGGADVGGYGSLQPNNYANTTGTHTLNSVDPCALARGVFAPLRLQTVVASPSVLSIVVATPPTTIAPPFCSDVPAPGTQQRRSLYIGQPETVQRVQVVDRLATRGDTSRVGVYDSEGHLSWPGEQLQSDKLGTRVTFAHPLVITGIAVDGRAAKVTDATYVQTITGSYLDFEGQLQDSVGLSNWHFKSVTAGLCIFTNLDPLVAATSHQGGSANLKVVDRGANGSETDIVVARTNTTIVRSVADDPGWTATITPLDGGASRSVPVVADGLVQSVRVPQGSWRLVFRYRPAGLVDGLALSGLATLALVLTPVGLAWSRRRSTRGTSLG